eukprot:TRINITY_DN15798_c0_g1_i1.p1 TRINITY_DN15798_c0_g1~~TRINITY_DN15798_c0_g1_i1.p1  ORF type:complete len:303 (-),score=8.29 TRINITY_DN15798_c0_g1_i1:304-1212(-)
MDRLSGIKHPRLVMLMGACPDGGCIVSEYMPRGSLEDVLLCKNETPPLPWFDRVRIAAEVCEGLLFMHGIESQPIFHHDLKPSNILLDNDFGSKIADVGLLRLVSDRSRLGTLGTNTDTHNYGLILLRLLTGKLELPSGMIDSLVTEIDEEEDDEVEEIREENPVEKILDPAAKWPLRHASRLAEIAVRCIKKDPEKALEMAMEALESILASAREPEARPRPFLTVPEGFRCPICWRLMEDPYVAADGFSYEFQEIKAWIESGNDRSPVTNAHLESDILIPNHSLRSTIDFWRNQTDCFAFD